MIPIIDVLIKRLEKYRPRWKLSYSLPCLIWPWFIYQMEELFMPHPVFCLNWEKRSYMTSDLFLVDISCWH